VLLFFSPSLDLGVQFFWNRRGRRRTMRHVPFLALLLSAGCGPSCHENERHASAALKTLTVANVDFRSNDRDNNGVNDFWTGDVASLYDLKPRGSQEPVKLILQEVAAADPSRPGGRPYHGYWFVAMEKDENGEPYRQASGGKDSGEKKYNTSKFGFCAYPAEPGVTGKAVFIVNEGNTIFKRTRKLVPILEYPMSDERDELPPSPPLPLLQVADADGDLKQSLIAPVLQTPHAEGANLVWCVTLQLAWDEMADDLQDPAPTLIGGPAYVAQLNAGRGARGLVKEDWYVALAGSLKDGIVEKIHARMAKRFPGVSVPLGEIDPRADSIAFAYLRRILPFRTPFERYSEEFKFKGRSVSAFGVRPHGPRQAAADQVTVHGYSTPQDFTIELATTSEDDRMLIARLPRKGDLFQTVQAALARVASGRPESMHSQDELRIPCFNLDIRKRFKELEEKKFKRSGGLGDTLFTALQVNQFRLDEAGVKLVSYSKLEYSKINGDYEPPPPPAPKKLICDGPFLFMLLKKGAPLPYFAMWVENPELLCPR
jgi:hypothetical protein